MTQATFKRGSAPAESVAFQYLREQVARQMAGVHNALGAGASQSPKTHQPQGTAAKIKAKSEG